MFVNTSKPNLKISTWALTEGEEFETKRNNVNVERFYWALRALWSSNPVVNFSTRTKVRDDARPCSKRYERVYSLTNRRVLVIIDSTCRVLSNDKPTRLLIILSTRCDLGVETREKERNEVDVTHHVRQGFHSVGVAHKSTACLRIHW